MKAQPEITLQRVTMWCARHWIEAREAGLRALAAGDGAEYRRQRHEELEWFAALLVVNRLHLGIDPITGDKFINTSPAETQGPGPADATPGRLV